MRESGGYTRGYGPHCQPPVSLAGSENQRLFPVRFILGLGLILRGNGFIPGRFYARVNIPGFGQFSPTPGPGPPDLTVFMTLISSVQVVKRVFLSVSAGFLPVYEPLLVYSQDLRKVTFLLETRK